MATAPVAPPIIDDLPDPPTTNDPENFDPRMDATLEAQQAMVPQVRAAIANVHGNAASAYQSAQEAAGSAGAAAVSAVAATAAAAASASSAGAELWVPGSYSAGKTVRSPSNLRIYASRTSGDKLFDPAQDPANWHLATAGGLPDMQYAGTTATVSLNERSRFTNAAAVAVTVPPPARAGEEWEAEWENGRVDNSFDIGAATLRRNGVAITGAITNSQRMIVRLISVGANEWRFKQ